MGVHDRNYKAGIDPSLYTFTEKQMNEMSGENDNWENTDKPKREMVSGPVKPLTNGVNGSNGADGFDGRGGMLPPRRDAAG